MKWMTHRLEFPFGRVVLLDSFDEAVLYEF